MKVLTSRQASLVGHPDPGDALAQAVHRPRAHSPEGVVVALAPHAADIVIALVHLGEQLRNLLRRVLPVGVERHHALAAHAPPPSPRTRSKPAMIAMCWPKLPFSSTTRVTSGRFANCSRRMAAERSRLPSLTKITS